MFAPNYIKAHFSDKCRYCSYNAKRLESSLAFSIAFDESTDIQDNPQLAIFVRYLSSDLTIKAELLDLVAVGETTPWS